MPGQNVRKYKQNKCKKLVEIVEASEILERFQILPGQNVRKYKQNECAVQRRDGVYTEARGIRDVRDITSMPVSDWENTQEIQKGMSVRTVVEI